MTRRWSALVALALSLLSCSESNSSTVGQDKNPKDASRDPVASETGQDGSSGKGGGGADAANSPDAVPDTTQGDAGLQQSACTSGPAYLHGNVWGFWWNYRVSCDKQHKAYWRCLKQGGSCTSEKQAWDSCDVCEEEDGICIPRTAPGEQGCCDAKCTQGGDGCCDYVGQDEETCAWGYYRTCRLDCDTRKYEYDKMVGYFYGKEWKNLGDWSIIFDPSSGVKKGVKGEDDGSKNGSDDALGMFGCYELPTGKPLTITISLHDWEGEHCHGDDSCIKETLTPEPGRHYVWDLTGLHEWHAWDRGECVGPPSDLAAQLKPGHGSDVACTTSP